MASSAIVDDLSAVRGVIYCVEHIATGKKYVGQTRTHRENHGRYRPFGAEGRFKTHLSEAKCNTKHKSGHLLGTDIRMFGAEAFRVSTLEICDLDKLNEREVFWISECNTVYPSGYNLSPGAAKHSYQPIIPNPTPLATPGKRGGCESRSTETRAKMSERSKEISAKPEMRAARATAATQQHAAAKAARFAGVTVDSAAYDTYISTKGTRAFVRVDGVEASFASASKEESINRAKEFLSTLTQKATQPNCSGNP